MALNIALDILRIVNENDRDHYTYSMAIVRFLVDSQENDVIEYLDALNKKNMIKYIFVENLFIDTPSKKVTQYIIDHNWYNINIDENIKESLEDSIEGGRFLNQDVVQYQWKLEMVKTYIEDCKAKLNML